MIEPEVIVGRSKFEITCKSIKYLEKLYLFNYFMKNLNLLMIVKIMNYPKIFT